MLWMCRHACTYWAAPLVPAGLILVRLHRIQRPLISHSGRIRIGAPNALTALARARSIASYWLPLIAATTFSVDDCEPQLIIGMRPLSRSQNSALTGKVPVQPM